MAEVGNNETVASGMFTSRITSDDKITTRYDLNKVTDIQGLEVDSWELESEYDGVFIELDDKSKKYFLVVYSGSYGYMNGGYGYNIPESINVLASNKLAAEEENIEATVITLTTNIFSFGRKIQDFVDIVNADEQFFINIGRSMIKVSGSINNGK